MLKYSDMKGWLELRQALCDLLARTTMQDVGPTPENLVLQAGVSGILDSLLFILADVNTSCILPAPCYPMYDLDLGARAEVAAQRVDLINCTDDCAELDRAFQSGQAARQPVRVLLLTSPDNPTGVIYSGERLRAMMKWCLRKKVHCIINECYCWSTPSDAPLRSALCVAADLAGELEAKEQEKLWELVHIVIGMSKDFCASGMIMYKF